MRLQDKFKKVFILPLICGILISIILTVIILILYAKQFADDDLVKRLQSVENDKTLPIIQTTKNMLYKKFQQSIYSIELFANYYNFFSGYLKWSDEIDDEKKNFINKYSLSAVKVANNYNDVLNLLKAGDNSSYLDYAEWHFNDQTQKIEDVLTQMGGDAYRYKLFLKQLNVFTTMIQVFRSIYEVSKENLSNRFDLIYVGSQRTNLFYMYPTYSNNLAFYNNFKSFNNPSYCKNETGITPNYYFFPCRDWFQQVIDYNYQKLPNTSVVITHPYKFAQYDQKFGLSVCIQFDENAEYKNADANKDNFVDIHKFVLCVDLELTDIMQMFDHFNKQLSGYFYILRIKSDIPIYYPMMIKLPYFSNIERFEFDMNVTYYVEELLSFENELKNLSAQYTYDDASTNTLVPAVDTIKGSYMKNGEVNNYTIYPVKLFIDVSNPSNPIHVMSVIYISQDSIFTASLQSFQDDLYPRLIIQIFLFGIMGAILVLVAWYLIISIAQNIIKPIKNLKNLIKGMNNSDNKKQENELRPNEEDNENDNEVDEETLDVRSAEIDNLFNILLKLKNVLSFTSNTKVVQDKAALLNYINAKYTFNEVSNLKGKNLCDSNVGNLAIKCRKYDKAIFHLLEAIKENKKETLVNADERDESVLDVKPADRRKSRINKTTSLNEDDRTESKSLLMKNDSIKAVFLESRYPKLIYSYKKFFNNLKKIMNSQEFYDDVTKVDIFAIKDRHSLEEYENVLKEYLDESDTTGDNRRVAEALLELNEFLINYKLKSNSDDIPSHVQEAKIQVFRQIVKNFQRFDELYEKLKSSNTAEYLKNFLEILRNNKKDNFEIIETPFMILCQRSNYLKGKLSRYCGHYLKALDFFFKSRETQIICDASIIKKSIKQIKKIMMDLDKEIEKMNSHLENLRQTTRNSTVNEKKSKMEQNAKIRESIAKYIDSLDKDLAKFTYQPKDLVVVIDFSETMAESDGKKIKNAVKTAQNIFDIYITQEDKFALFLYTKSVNPIISLTQKNINTFTYVKDVIENLISNYTAYEFKGKTNLLKALVVLNDYLRKKSSQKREKWIILFTDSFNFSEKDDEKIKETMNIFKENSEDIFNVVVVGMSMMKDSAQLLAKNLEFNKSCYLDFDNIGKLKNILKIMGTIKEELTFQNERYEADKKGE